MRKVIIWGTGRQYNRISKDIISNMMGGVEIIAVTTNDNICGMIDGVPIVEKKSLRQLNYDYILVMTDLFPYSKVCKEAEKMGLDKTKMLSIDVLMLPGFTLEKYAKLVKSNISIIAPCCFGGFLYNHFKLPFLSPTINLWFSENDYMCLLSNFYNIINSELRFFGINHDSHQGRIYPIFQLNDDVLVHMNHTSDSIEGKKKWDSRVKRINYDNLLIMNYTKDKDVLERFDALPFKRKICFVPFKSKLASAWYISDNILSPENYKTDLHFGWAVNRWADGRLAAYDLWDLLLYQRKTPRLSILEM